MEIELEKYPLKPLDSQFIPVYMIMVPTSYESMHYCKYSVDSWRTRGYTVNKVPALKAEDPFYKFHEDKFHSTERSFGKRGKRKFYKSEISRFLSHVKLWQYMVNSDVRKVFIVEHDCMLQDHVPDKFVSREISFLAKSANPNFYTNYKSPGIKSCTGYFLRIDHAIRLLEDFESLPFINFNIEKYLYVMSIFDMKYSAAHFLEAKELPAIEIYDAEIGNTVKDEL